MTLKKLILPVLLLLCQFAVAQADSVYVMDEVVITDTQLKDFSTSQSVQQLKDSVIRRSQPSLTSLLRFNSVIYFKENGPGMVSSPSFRGTTAAQTAVIWNGININSQLNGQTDFNTITTHDFSNISVRTGGGSVIYGSSAIGGSIHLNNDLQYGNHFTNEVKLDYGSFNTLGANYKLSAAYNSFSTNVSISRNSSDNDYEYPGFNMKNENGQYYNTSFNASFGYKIDDRNTLKLYSYAFDGERHFSGTRVAPSRSMYADFNTRNLFEWESQFSGFTSRLKAAYFTEEYKYFENYRNDAHTFGSVKTYLGRYDLTYDVTAAIKLNAIVDYTNSRGEGTDIDNSERRIGSGSLLFKHSVGNRFGYELGVRKEITNVYESPLLFSFGTSFKAADFYNIKLNASRNFRMPTFNDLYWTGSGNPDLNPETSYQAEIGNVFTYGNATLTVTGYYIKLDNMLRWVPGSGSAWSPENVLKANTYGAEALFSWHKTFGRSEFIVNGTYAYTESHKEGQSEQLIYVPYHKATASVAYSYKKLSAYYTHLFTGEVFTLSDNSSKLDPYNVSNIGLEYHIQFLQGLDVGVQVLNLWQEEYENVVMRPMPGRNYNAYINFKF
jgi:iron complex outermembrane receptor protein